MGRTELGRSIHALLVSETKRRLVEMGCDPVLTDARIGDSKIDAIGILNGEKIGVECLVKCVPSLLKKTTEKYKQHLDTLILCVPSYTKMPNTDAEIWRIEIHLSGGAEDVQDAER